MSKKERFEIKQKDTLIDSVPLPTTHTVEVKDNKTGKTYKGSSTTVEGAKKSAFDKIKK